MRDLLAAEWRKLFVGRTLLSLAAVSVVLGVLAAIGFTRGVETQLADPGAVAAATDQLVRSWFLTLLFAALFGALLVTREFGTGAIARSVLLGGGRGRVFAAKLVTGTGAGVLFGAMATALAAVSPWIFLGLRTGVAPHWTAETSLTLVGVFAVTVAGAAWGVLVGWVIRRRTVAVGVLLVLTLLVDESLFRLFPAVGRFTMTIAMGSVYRDGKPELLPVPGALAVIAAWLLLAGAAGYVLLRLRDVR